jgi:hypothetical protein
MDSDEERLVGWGVGEFASKSRCAVPPASVLSSSPLTFEYSPTIVTSGASSRQNGFG